jgi:lipopolysaccharide export system protein LptA
MGGGVAALCLLIPQPGSGEEMGPSDGPLWRLENPVEIQARTLELRRPENIAVYSGQVVASQQEYQLKCDRLEVYWDPETKKVAQLVARGQVTLETDEGIATAGKGVLDLESKTIVLTESPHLIRGEESIEGERIIYSVSERKSTVVGGKGKRVQSRIIPRGQH